MRPPPPESAERPDPRVLDALRTAYPDPEAQPVDWTSLQGAILTAARAPLGRRRRLAGWIAAWTSWRPWLAPTLPALAVAGVVLLLVGRPSPPAPEPAAPVAAVPVEEVLLADASEPEIRALLLGRDDPRALLRLAVAEN